MHVNQLSIKLKRANGALSKLRRFLQQSLFISVYHAIFSSCLNYAYQTWGQRQTNITRRVFLLQKCSVRIISKLDWKAHSYPVFLNLSINVI